MSVKTPDKIIFEKIEEYLLIFGIKNKLEERMIRKRMLLNIRQNTGIYKIRDLDVIVFLLMSKAIKDLNINVDRVKINNKIKTHIYIGNVMKQFNNINL